jgi:protein phosphatase
VEIIGRSDIGKVRKNNEDFIDYDEAKGIAVLADGMGGLDAGEIASRTAVQEIMTKLAVSSDVREDALLKAVAAANRSVFSQTQVGGRSSNMGTTVVVWVAAEHGQCFIAHVGDSRAYRWREAKLSALTSDHSLVQQMVDEGVLSASEALVAPNRNVVTRGIGLAADVATDVRSCVHAAGDVFLLCSDGLSDLVADSAIAAIFTARLQGSGDLLAAVEELIEAANQAGGVDNISVILIRPDG